MFNSSNEKKRVAIYCRVSTDEQVQNGNGLEIQKEALLNYIRANEHQYVIDDKNIYIDEGKSGASKDEKDRPALFKMFGDAQKKEFDVVLVWKIDRFFRKTLYLLEGVDALDSLGIGFISITQNFDTTQAFGKMMLQMMGVIAELERELIKERTHSGILAIMRKGKWGRGLYPYGYKKDSEGYLTIDEDEAKIVKMIFNLLVNEKYTLNKIQDYLNKLSIETSTYKGKLGNKRIEQLKHKNHWHRMTVHRIVTNELYTGTLIQNRYIKARKDNKKVERPKKDWIISECPKIIDKDIFIKAQKQLDINSNYSKRNKKEGVEYMLSTLLIDKQTGYKYSGYTSSKGTKNYRVDIKNKSKEKVKQNGISGNKIESVVWNKLYLILKKPELILEELKKIYSKNKGRNINDEINILKDKRLKIKNNSKNLLKLTNGLTNESLEDIKEILEENNLNISNIDDEINKLSLLELTEEQKTNQLNDLIKLSISISKELDNLTYEEKTKICRNLIDSIYIDGEEVEIIMLVPISGGNKKRQNRSISSITDFFEDKSSFLKDNLKTPLPILNSEEELCNINGRKRKTRTYNPAFPKRVRYQLRQFPKN